MCGSEATVTKLDLQSTGRKFGSWPPSTADRQRLEAFIRRSHRSRFVPPDLPAFAAICLSADEKLFSAVIRDSDHVLHKLLPPLSTASQSYNLRERKHKKT